MNLIYFIYMMGWANLIGPINIGSSKEDNISHASRRLVEIFMYLRQGSAVKPLRRVVLVCFLAYQCPRAFDGLIIGWKVNGAFFLSIFILFLCCVDSSPHGGSF